LSVIFTGKITGAYQEDGGRLADTGEVAALPDRWRRREAKAELRYTAAKTSSPPPSIGVQTWAPPKTNVDIWNRPETAQKMPRMNP
jgi:hypothetical protein